MDSPTCMTKRHIEDLVRLAPQSICIEWDHQKSRQKNFSEGFIMVLPSVLMLPSVLIHIGQRQLRNDSSNFPNRAIAKKPDEMTAVRRIKMIGINPCHVPTIPTNHSSVYLFIRHRLFFYFSFKNSTTHDTLAVMHHPDQDQRSAQQTDMLPNTHPGPGTAKSYSFCILYII
ncbi:4-sulfomuconolactone hydrolase [Fusarium oxysporum f. sp. albedinis]|nr:4-sulfomuconolactone hydrolase [Fusarium oxysporum f. sp. albedinis]